MEVLTYAVFCARLFAWVWSFLTLPLLHVRTMGGVVEVVRSVTVDHCIAVCITLLYR